jgi:hypothetical protein
MIVARAASSSRAPCVVHQALSASAAQVAAPVTARGPCARAGTRLHGVSGVVELAGQWFPVGSAPSCWAKRSSADKPAGSSPAPLPPSPLVPAPAPAAAPAPPPPVPVLLCTVSAASRGDGKPSRAPRSHAAGAVDPAGQKLPAGQGKASAGDGQKAPAGQTKLASPQAPWEGGETVRAKGLEFSDGGRARMGGGGEHALKAQLQQHSRHFSQPATGHQPRGAGSRLARLTASLTEPSGQC